MIAGTAPARPAASSIREVHMNALKNDSQRGLARGALLWMIGIPLPIILLLWLFGFDM
jgi:hypothetical protein